MKKNGFLTIIVAIFVILSIMCVSLFTSAAESGPNNGDSTEKISNVTILSIDGKSKELQFNSVTPSGPNSFYVVNDNEVYIADQYDKRINYYKNGILEKEILFPNVNFITDFYIANNEIFLLDDYFFEAHRVNDIICTDMDGNIKYRINIPNDSAFLEMKNTGNYDRRYRVRRIYDINGYITCEFSDSLNYIYKDSKWVKYADDDLQKNINTHMVTFNKWSDSIIQMQGEIEYVDVIKTNEDILVVSAGAVIKEEGSYSEMQCLYMINENGIRWVQPVKTYANAIPNKQFFISEDNQIYQMYNDENNNTFISKLKPGEYSIRYSTSESDPKHDSNDISKNKITLASYSSITREQIEDRATEFLNHTWTFNCYTNADDSILVGCTGESSVCNLHQDYIKLPSYLPQVKCTNSCNGHTATGIPYCWTGQCEMRIPANATYTHLQLYINEGSEAFDDQISNGYYAGNATWGPNPQTPGTHNWLFRTAGVDCSGYVQVCFEYNDSAKINCNWIKNTTDDFDSVSSLVNAKAMDLLVKTSHVMIIDEIEWNSTYNQINRVWVYECTTEGYDEVVYNDYTPAEIASDGYSIRRYKGVTSCTHSWSDWTTVISPTCISTGKAVSTCSICGEVDTYTIPITTHNYKPATCESPQTCWVCNATTGTANGHTWPSSWTITEYPTCTTTGTEEKHCTICSDLLDTQTIPKVAHTWPSTWTVTEYPTCTTTGTEEKHCTICSDLLDMQTIPKVAHTWPSSWTVTQYSNCWQPGKEVKLCTVCSFKLAEQTTALDPNNHSGYTYNEETTSPTCTTSGVSTTFCSGCDGALSTASIAALGHVWGSWIYQYTYYDPDLQSNVYVYKRTCSRCGAFEHDYI